MLSYMQADKLDELVAMIRAEAGANGKAA
jgi:hypothetical protein